MPYCALWSRWQPVYGVLFHSGSQYVFPCPHFTATRQLNLVAVLAPSLDEVLFDPTG
jgi:hypothetical protein